MLQISQKQMTVFEAGALLGFEDRTFLHLQRYFPGHCTLLGETQIRRVIRHGLKRAGAHGLTAECCARTYIEFMCLLGSSFDDDPLLPWAFEILDDRTEANQVARADRLYDRAWAYIRAVVPDYRDPHGNPTTARFVGELRQMMAESDRRIADHELPVFVENLSARLNGVFPSKHALVGDPAIGRLASHAIETARRHGIEGQRGTNLIAVLMFVLGRGVDSDLLLPWAEATLSDPELSDEATKVDRLFRAGAGELRRWWRLPHGTTGEKGNVA